MEVGKSTGRVLFGGRLVRWTAAQDPNAPGNSPNTDGIDVSDSSFVKIWNSNIGTGDDCIAINRGTSNINITGINCGPGHGISIGSLGENGAYETVENVRVSYSRFSGTTNGLRIKTFQGSGGVAIIGVTYLDVRGTSGTQVAITFDCSPNKGCNNILMDTVNLKSPYTTCSAFCRNAKGRAKSVSPVVPCLNMLQ
ncbi:hypothetical protein RIF29_24391 [Crotalaria pallida]|uniref:Polygalacturonase n=1 Tax=Crotalaria pallida TaxID=3830 RepID=A0AAN9HYV1_CROPI